MRLGWNRSARNKRLFISRRVRPVFINYFRFCKVRQDKVEHITRKGNSRFPGHTTRTFSAFFDKACLRHLQQSLESETLKTSPCFTAGRPSPFGYQDETGKQRDLFIF